MTEISMFIFGFLMGGGLMLVIANHYIESYKKLCEEWERMYEEKGK